MYKAKNGPDKNSNVDIQKNNETIKVEIKNLAKISAAEEAQGIFGLNYKFYQL